MIYVVYKFDINDKELQKLRHVFNLTGPLTEAYAAFIHAGLTTRYRKESF